jgi:hypothetical protein
LGLKVVQLVLLVLPDIGVVERGRGAMHDPGEDELLDLVDDQDQVIMQAWRSVIYREGRATCS